MSLINEALKKAQRQRNLEATPAASAPSGVAAAAVTTHVRVASHRSSSTPLWFGLGLLVLGGVVTAVVILFVLNPAPRIAPARPAAVASAPTSKAPAPAPAPAPPGEAPLPSIVLPSMSATAAASPPPVTAPASVSAPVVVSAPNPPSAPATVSTPPPPARPPAPLAPPPAVSSTARPATPAPAPVAVTRVVVSNDAKVYALLDKLRVTGVRGTGIEARVLMNEKVYRINDLIDRELGLRLTEVSSNLLVFVDASGRKYQKPL
jgi:hypothetical protein